MEGKIMEFLNMINSAFQTEKLDGRSDNGFERRAASAWDAENNWCFLIIQTKPISGTYT